MLRIFTWRRIEVFRLQMTEMTMMVVGFIGMPNMESCSKNVSKPPTVAVSVCVSMSSTICRAIW